VVAEPEELNYLWFFFCVFLGSIVYVYISSSAAAAALHQTNSKSEKAAKREKSVFQYTTPSVIPTFLEQAPY
jgi:hypothetical protein